MVETYLVLEDSASAMIDLTIKIKKVKPNAVIREASNVEEAKSLIENGDINIAFVDLSMPDKNGMDFIIDYLKKSNKTAGIPVIVVTGVDQTSILKIAVSELVHDYLQKPVDVKKLQEAIDSLNVV